MKKIIIFVFCFSVFNLLNALGTLRIESIEMLPETSMNIEVRDADGKYAPVLIVKTNLKGLGFQNVSRPTLHSAEYIAGDHHYKFYLNDNQRVVKITHSDYEPLEIRLLADFGINVKAQRVYELELITDKEEIQIASIGKGTLTITTEPSNANVKIEEYPDFEKQTPCVLENYPAITYHFNISKFRYSPVDTVFSIFEKEHIFEDVKLKPLWGDLTITSEPTGAEIYLNDNFFGSTPLNLHGAKEGLSSGVYKLSAKPNSALHDYYLDTLYVANGKLIKKHIDFIDISGAIEINSNIDNLKIMVNGIYDEILSNKETKRYPKGEYNIEIQKDGVHATSYIPIKKNIQLKEGEIIVIRDSLFSKKGILTVTSNIENTKFEIIDKETDSIVYVGNQVNNIELLTGNYKIISNAEFQKFIVLEKDIQIEYNKKEIINFAFSERHKTEFIRKIENENEIERQKNLNFAYNLYGNDNPVYLYESMFKSPNTVFKPKPMLYLFNGGFGFQTPILAKLIIFNRNNLLNDNISFYYGFSSIGNILISNKIILIDAWSFQAGALIKSDDHKNRFFVDIDFGGKWVFNLSYFRSYNSSVKGIDDDGWVPADLSFCFERHTILDQFLVIKIGTIFYAGKEFKEKDIINLGSNPYFAVGYRF